MELTGLLRAETAVWAPLPFSFVPSGLRNEDMIAGQGWRSSSHFGPRDSPEVGYQLMMMGRKTDEADYSAVQLKVSKDYPSP